MAEDVFTPTLLSWSQDCWERRHRCLPISPDDAAGFYSQVGAMMKGSDSRWQTSSADSSESDSTAGQAGDGVDESDSSIRARRGAGGARHHPHRPQYEMK